MLLAQNAGMNVYVINDDQAPYLLWADILKEAATQGATRQLVTLARDQNPKSPHRPLLNAVLAGTPVVTEREPRGANGEPAFRTGDDSVTESEALLFHDDLTISSGRLRWLIEVLERLEKVAPAVCRLDVVATTGEQTGTAFRIGSDLLLTNWHVLYLEGTKATAVTAEFGFEHDSAGNARPGTPVACDVGSIVADEDDDWGVIRVKSPLDGSIPTISPADAAVPVNDAPAYIVQHPNGQRKRVGYVRNRITSWDDRVVKYLTDTQQGSSGAPVFNEAGRLIALHHAGGRPQEVAGQPPCKKNEGIRISRIVKGLADAGVAF